MRKLILQNFQSPGDIVMLTAAVRDLHQCYPKQFLTDVRTPCPALWENNPFITRLEDDDPEAPTLQCEYPLIHQSNQRPVHFLWAFSEFLNEKLGLHIKPTAFKGDIHISEREKSWYSQVREILGQDIPFWIVVAGGKNDFTIKWWEERRFQEVVKYFRGKLLFVQVGENGHRHPPLQGVLDLRGKTDLRQLVRLMYHADGVVCPVTLAMHLAAAVPTRTNVECQMSNEGKPRGHSEFGIRHPPLSRPCVVIAGGREPSQWEAYPHHQYIHTNGALLCCDNGGCWKSRTVPLGDGDKKDLPDQLCLDVVNGLPRCMDLITSEEVCRRINLYLRGGAVRQLTREEWQVAEAAIKRQNGQGMVPPAPQPKPGREMPVAAAR